MNSSWLSRNKGVLFAAPWIIGLAVFTLYPFLAAFYYSFTDFSVLLPPEYVGAENFKELINDSVFWLTLKNTLLYAGLSIPISLCAALVLALLMNGIKRGQALYSVIFYLPHLVPVVASTILWMWIYNSQYGLLNNAIRPVYDFCNSIHSWLSPSWADALKTHPDLAWAPPSWLGSANWALPALVLMSLWGIGQSAFIYLAKLQEVPPELYEAAELDGASTWQKIWHVTLPMISPIIFFNVIMGIIGAFQVFSEPYIMTQGGPAQATYFLPHYIFDNAFTYMRMGYACALSIVLFLVILTLTIMAYTFMSKRVYYAGK